MLAGIPWYGCERGEANAILHFMPDSANPTPLLPLASSLEHSERQFEALLAVSETIAQQHDLSKLFHELAERLHSVLAFDFLALVLHEPSRNTMRLHILETREAPVKEPAHEFPVENHPAGWVWQNQRPFLTLDTEKDARYPDFMQRLLEAGVHSFAIVPLTTAQHRLGAMAIGRYVPQGLSDAEVDFIQRVARQVAVAVDNALNLEAGAGVPGPVGSRTGPAASVARYQQPSCSTRDTGALFKGIVSSLKPVLRHDYTSLALLDESSGLLKIHALDLPGSNSKLPNRSSPYQSKIPPARTVLLDWPGAGCEGCRA